jgi:hypothetical protein
VVWETVELSFICDSPGTSNLSTSVYFPLSTLTPSDSLSHRLFLTVPFFFFGWGGKVSEFSIVGWSQNVINPSINDPEKPITFKFDIHLVRKAQYYYLKICEFMFIALPVRSQSFGGSSYVA